MPRDEPVLHRPPAWSRAEQRAMQNPARDCPTGKVGYRTKRKALRVLEARRRDPAHTEVRAYRCQCGSWHLTSQPNRPSQEAQHDPATS